MARRRSFTTFNLSFLDVMSCGFGAVILIFLIIDHASEIHAEEVNKDILSEVNLLEEEILEGEENLVQTKNTIDTVDQQIVEAEGESRRVIEVTRKLELELANLDEAASQRAAKVKKLKQELRDLEQQREELQDQADPGQGQSARETAGDGDRQYLTGLKLGGKRVLILLDVSGSMLHDRLVNIVRMRNMADSVKLRAKKWQRAVKTVGWISAQLPQASQYQIYTFSNEVRPALENTDGQWLAVSDGEQLDAAIEKISSIAPNGGTNLENLFSKVSSLSPLPDNILLITDGLPTLGANSARTGTVTGEQRLKIFNKAVRQLPRNVPVNVILAPLEGDPLAAAAYWKLALATKGSFLSPSPDWP